MLNTGNRTTKLVIEITIAAIAVIVLAFGTIGILRFVAAPAEPPADDKKQTALRAQSEFDKANNLLKKGNKEEAKRAFENARDLYKQAQNTSKLKEINASLSLLQNTDLPTEPKNEPPVATP